MKTKEEIDKLANEYADAWFQESEEESASRGYIDGYTQCQEDMAKEIVELKMLCRDMSRIYSKDVKALNNMLNSLNKQD